MGQAKVEIYGHIADIQEGLTPKGKKYFKIKMACGRSEKKTDGSYDNTNQAWWELTAWNRRTQNIGKKECCVHNEEQEG